jgi:hypothetical protein
MGGKCVGRIRNVFPNSRVIRAAEKEARKSCVKRARISALALDRRGVNIIGLYYNRYIYGLPRKWTIHAEEGLMLRVRKPVHKVLVCRSKHVGFGTSRPCRMCMAKLCEAGVSRVLYHDGKGWVSELVA